MSQHGKSYQLGEVVERWAKGVTAEMSDEQVLEMWARMPAWQKANLLAQATRQSGGNRAQRRAQVRVAKNQGPPLRTKHGRPIDNERSKG
jgi:hypothetical protein